MKRPVLQDYRWVLALLVLFAATVDLLLPSPRCTDSGVPHVAGQLPAAADQCLSSTAMTGSDQREP